MKNRILYVDYMKAFAMVLVIMGHVNFANEPVKAWIYSFHMPAFFFCTGLVLSVNKPYSFKETFKNKFHRLMLPYLLWALIYANYTVTNLLKICYGSSWSIQNSGSLIPLWFLPVMFLALMFFYLYAKTGLANNLFSNLLVIAISFSAGCFLPHIKIGYPFGANVAFMGFAFLMFGFVLKRYIGKIYQFFLADHRKGITISSFLFLLLFVGTFSYHLNSYVSMRNAQYGNYGLFALTAVCGTMMLLFLSMFTELLNKQGYKWLSFIGQNSLCIYFIHKPIIACFKSLFQRMEIMPEALVLTVTTVATLMLACVISMVINKYVPVLAGK